MDLFECEASLASHGLIVKPRLKENPELGIAFSGGVIAWHVQASRLKCSVSPNRERNIVVKILSFGMQQNWLGECLPSLCVFNALCLIPSAI